MYCLTFSNSPIYLSCCSDQGLTTTVMIPRASASMCEHQLTLSSTCSHTGSMTQWPVYCSFCILREAAERAIRDKLHLYKIHRLVKFWHILYFVHLALQFHGLSHKCSAKHSSNSSLVMCFCSHSLSPEAAPCLVWKLFVFSIKMKCYIQTCNLTLSNLPPTLFVQMICETHKLTK